MSSTSSASTERPRREMFDDLFQRVVEHCSNLPDSGTDKMPAYAKAIRAAYVRHGLTPSMDADRYLGECERAERYSAAVTIEAVNAGIPEDEVMTLVYLIF